MTAIGVTQLLLKATPQCPSDNEYNGHDRLRVLSVILILIASAAGVYFPLFASSYSVIRLPERCFFFAKYFGSGVIIATGFVHLLEPATKSLGNPCLGDFFTEFPWAFAILQVAIFLLFLFDIISHFYHDPDQIVSDTQNNVHDTSESSNLCHYNPGSERYFSDYAGNYGSNSVSTLVFVENRCKEKILSLFVLEFGLIFHSIFIGLSLAVAGDELKTLLAVLIFHQLFEGMGLGARIVEIKWPSEKSATPWLLALAFSITTPLSIVAGLFLRESFSPGSKRALITSGIFDAFSAGILIYTGLVELIANEFLHNDSFLGENKLKSMLSGSFIMILGSALMTILGKWA